MPFYSKIVGLILIAILGFSVPILAQSISGLVCDSKQMPIIGAAVLDQASKKGTTTDFDGKFNLNVTANTGVLTISYLGYRDMTVKYEVGKLVEVVMVEDVVALDELVVVGYGVQKKSDLTGSVSSVTTKDIIKMPTTGVAQALQGKASGVEIVQNSGAPGSSTTIRIRGMGTVNNSDPLYVVDGMPMENINYLSPDDISGIEILKDASSAAIYGSKAANGVVLVTTKSGKGSTKNLNINFNSYVGFQDVWKEPGMLKKEDYMYFSDYVQNQYVKTELNGGRLRIKDEFGKLLENGNDWFDLVTRVAMMQKYNISLFGGEEKLNYFISGNYQKTDGLVKSSDYSKKGINIKLKSKLLKNLTLGANLTFAQEDRTVVGEGTWGVIKTAINYNPLTPIYDINESYNWTTPVENLRRTTYESFGKSLIGQLTLDWNITKDIVFSSRASIYNYESDIDQFVRYNINPEIVGNIKYEVKRNPTNSSDFSWDNILTYSKKIKEHEFSVMGGQTLEMSDYQTTSAYGIGNGGYEEYYDALNLVNFSQKVQGYATMTRSVSFLGRVNYTYGNKYLFQTNFRADGSSRFAKKNRWGFFPSFSVGWKVNEEAFLKEVDALSLLKVRFGWGKLGNNRIGNFAYNTYVGQLGQYIYGTGMPGIVNAMGISSNGNENIRWESTQSTTIGLDLNLWNNRFTSSVEFFTKDTRDMLLAIPIVYSSGYPSTPTQNAGSVNNKGIEVQLAYRDQIGELHFEIGGNITGIKNKVTSLGTANEPIYGGNLTSPNSLGYVNKTVVGMPIGCFYGYKTDGILTPDDFENGKPKVPVFVSSTPFQPGDMKFKDVNGDNKIDENDQTFLGSPHPKLFYGINLNLEYRGFDLQMFFQGTWGNKLYNAMKYFQYSMVDYNGGWNANGNNYSNVATDYFEKVYRPEPDPTNPAYRDNWGGNSNGTVPAPSSDNSRNQLNFSNSDFYIENGSYLRLKNVQLGYNFSKNLCSKMKMTNMRIYASVTNALTFTNYEGLDPEIGKKAGTESNNLFIGIDEGSYPQARTFIFGLMFDF